MKQTHPRRLTGFAQALAAASLLTLAACASTPPPTDALTSAENAIKRAEEARVADYASLELKNARDKLVAARDAVTREDMVGAERLAQQAKVDAELATAKAESAKAQAAIDEMRKGNEALRQEALRNSANVPPVALPAPPPPAPPTMPRN